MNGTGRPGGGRPGHIGIPACSVTSGDVGPGGKGTGIGGSTASVLHADRKVPAVRTVRGTADGRRHPGFAQQGDPSRARFTRHLNQVASATEQQLIAHPDLQGRVAVKFIIGPDGSVKAATRDHSDLGNAAVERCVVDAVNRWTFPAPEGGGLVIVTYPFVFAQVGN